MNFLQLFQTTYLNHSIKLSEFFDVFSNIFFQPNLQLAILFQSTLTPNLDSGPVSNLLCVLTYYLKNNIYTTSKRLII